MKLEISSGTLGFDIGPCVESLLDVQPSSFEDFEREARQGNVVPVVRSVAADLLTPIAAFMCLAGDSPVFIPT